MISKSVTGFLKELDRNNNRAWFEENRTQYEMAKKEFAAFISSIIKGIGTFDKSIAGLEAKDCMFRINRDVRFSKDKRPYKINMAGYFNKDGKKGPGAGYYIHIQPGGSFAAGGIWMPEPGTTANIRQEIDYNFDEWKKITGNTAFKKHFPGGLDKSQSLSRPPKGYDAENPAIEFLKLKSFVVTKPFSDKEIAGAGFSKELLSTFRSVKPMIDFLNRSAD